MFPIPPGWELSSCAIPVYRFAQPPATLHAAFSELRPGQPGLSLRLDFAFVQRPGPAVHFIQKCLKQRIEFAEP